MTYTAKRALLLVGLLLSSLTASATIFGTVTGLIHDPQHRPVQGAQVPEGSHTLPTPQAVNALGGYRSRGHGAAERGAVLHVRAAQPHAFKIGDDHRGPSGQFA